MGKKGQVAMEYMMVVGFAFLVIVPGVYFYMTYSKTAEFEIASSQVLQLGRTISSQAESIYYHGYPSKLVVKAALPKGIKYIEIARNSSASGTQGLYEIIFWLNGPNGDIEQSIRSNVNIIGFFTPESWQYGNRVIRLFASQNKNNEPFVLVTILGDCDISVEYDSNSDSLVNNNDFTMCSSVPCYGGPSTACTKCDYDGSCLIDNTDLILWNVLARASYPPTAKIEGPDRGSVGTQISFTVAAFDPDNNLNQVRIFSTPTGTDSPSLVGTCPVGSQCTLAWTPASGGEYYVYALASDSTGVSCSGSPLPQSNGYSDCGLFDFLEVEVG